MVKFNRIAESLNFTEWLERGDEDEQGQPVVVDGDKPRQGVFHVLVGVDGFERELSSLAPTLVQILEVVLLDPDGTPHDLTGSTGWALHIWLSDGTTKLTRSMVKHGVDANGTLRYSWIGTEWDAGAGGPPYTSGGLVVGPTLPLKPGQREHRMEYEVVGPGIERLTFPNDGYDILRIVTDVGEQA